MKAIKLFSMAVAALILGACSNEDNDIQQSAQTRTLHFVATIAAPNSGASTRTTYTEVTESTDPDFGKIKVAWEENDEIALLHNSKKEVVKVKTVNSDGSATIEGDITGASDGDDVRLVYPASGINADGSVPATAQAQQLLQNGTLAYIQNALDARMGTGKISVSGSNASLKENVTMASQMAIWKLTLQDNAATPNALSVTTLKLTVSSTVGSIDVARASASPAKSEWYISYPVAAIAKGSITGDLTIRATVGTETYIYKKAGGVSLTAGKYYQSTVSMTKLYPIALSAVTSDYIGSVVTSDGYVYAKAADATAASKTAVAMIAYVGDAGSADNSTGSDAYRGLALALENAGANVKWCSEYGAICLTTQYNSGQQTNDMSGIDNTNDLITGHAAPDDRTHPAASAARNYSVARPTGTSAWFLPSAGQWDKMVNACKNVLGTNGNYTDLRDGFSARGGTNLLSAYYQTSTENTAAKSFRYDFSTGNNGNIDYKDVSGGGYVRPAFAF